MSRKQLKLINKARRKYGTIYPCARKENYDQCFTQINKKLYFWFNSQDQSTHIVSEEVRG